MSYARQQMLIGLTHPGFSGDSRRVLLGTLGLLDTIQDRWSKIVALYEQLPTTLIHGDFVCKNVRARYNGLARELCVLDWEQAGWGSPGSDLVTLAREHADLPERPLLEAYVDAAQSAWGCGVEAMQNAATVGMVFRSIRRTATNGHSIAVGPVDWLMNNLSITAERCHGTLRVMGWTQG
jgi:aminoglycoside phosphotransferase (APT) family kinase protein